MLVPIHHQAKVGRSPCSCFSRYALSSSTRGGAAAHSVGRALERADGTNKAADLLCAGGELLVVNRVLSDHLVDRLGEGVGAPAELSKCWVWDSR